MNYALKKAHGWGTITALRFYFAASCAPYGRLQAVTNGHVLRAAVALHLFLAANCAKRSVFTLSFKLREAANYALALTTNPAGASRSRTFFPKVSHNTTPCSLL